MMTKREKIAKSQIIDKLLEGGYRTYAELFDLFELHLTTRPDVVGYMLPGMAEIWISEYLDIEQVSLVVRHEILHEYYEHMKRYKEIHKGNPPKDDPFMNVSADYEISNVGYTEQDKVDAKRIKIGGKELEGLVTSIDRPELADKTFEEIYEVLRKESPESVKKPHIGERGDQQLEEAERAKARAEAIKEMAEEMSDSSEGGEQGTDGSSSSPESGDSSRVSSTGSGDDGEEEGSDTEEEGSNDKESSSSPEGESNKKSRQKYDDEEYQKMSPEEKKRERARRRKEAAKKLKEEADRLINKIDEVVNDIKSDNPPEGDSNGSQEGPGGPGGEGDGNVFEPPEEKAERAERIKKINEALHDLDKAAKAKDEATSAILKEKAVKAANDSNKYRNNPLTRFTESLNRFIKDSTARARNSSWAHINKKYVNSGLLRPGSSYSAKGEVPLINVYFDRSGSWNAAKTETGKQAIATLVKYQTRGEIKVNLYYFDTKVSSTDSGLGGGTEGQPIIEHIKQTKPNNVIILTDGDIKDIHESLIVPGAVWFLFYPEAYGSEEGVVIGSPNLVQHLKGRQLTKVFTIGSKVKLEPGITANGWSGKED